ncbi:MAG: cytochrome c biogenesis protein CcdA, partial [Atribacterota bacterium]|nr:cytochrome c biogenesis protein CcdA [Atribacterota bacterium]
MSVIIFEWLNNLLQSSYLFALIASFVWGILSILLSPCHLASIPLIVAFIGEQGRMTTRRAFWLSTSFSVGILITIGVIGLITGLMGRMLGDVGVYGNYFVALIFFVIGLHLLEVIEI